MFRNIFNLLVYITGIRAKAFYAHNSRNVAAKLLKHTRNVSLLSERRIPLTGYHCTIMAAGVYGPSLVQGSCWPRSQASRRYGRLESAPRGARAIHAEAACACTWNGNENLERCHECLVYSWPLVMVYPQSKSNKYYLYTASILHPYCKCPLPLSLPPPVLSELVPSCQPRPGINWNSLPRLLVLVVRPSSGLGLPSEGACTLIYTCDASWDTTCTFSGLTSVTHNIIMLRNFMLE